MNSPLSLLTLQGRRGPGWGPGRSGEQGGLGLCQHLEGALHGGLQLLGQGHWLVYAGRVVRLGGSGLPGHLLLLLLMLLLSQLLLCVLLLLRESLLLLLFLPLLLLLLLQLLLVSQLLHRIPIVGAALLWVVNLFSRPSPCLTQAVELSSLIPCGSLDEAAKAACLVLQAAVHHLMPDESPSLCAISSYSTHGTWADRLGKVSHGVQRGLAWPCLGPGWWRAGSRWQGLTPGRPYSSVMWEPHGL